MSAASGFPDHAHRRQQQHGADRCGDDRSEQPARGDTGDRENLAADYGADDTDRARLERHGGLVRDLGRVESVEFLAAGAAAPPAATALLGELRILVPMAGLIDVAAERERLAKQLTRTETELSKSEAKLANPRFRDKAPAEIVAKEQDRESEFRRQIDQIREQLTRLEGLS